MTAVPESADRYNNVSRHVKILSVQQTKIDEIQIKLAALPAALERARQDIKYWSEQGIEASYRKAAGKVAQTSDDVEKTK